MNRSLRITPVLFFILLSFKLTNPTMKAQAINDLYLISWSPSGNYLATGHSDGTIRVWDVQTYQLLEVLSHESSTTSITALDWSPDSTEIASGSWDGNLFVWNVTNGQLERYIGSHEGGTVKEVKWYLDANRIASASSAVDTTYTLKIWDTSTGTLLHETNLGDIWNFTWNSEGNALAYVGSRADGGIYNVASYNRIQELRVFSEQSQLTAGRMMSIAWNSGNSRLVTGSFEGIVRMWDSATAEILWEQTASELNGDEIGINLIRSVVFSPDGSKVMSLSRGGTLRTLNTTTGAILETQQLPAPMYGFAWSPDRTRLIYGNATGSLEAVNTLDNTLGNRIWLDANGNGIQDTGEMGMPGLTVHLLNNNFGIVKTVQTNAYGFYTFADLVPGTHYYIQIIPPTDTYTIAPVDRGTDDTLDSDFDWRDNPSTPDPTDCLLISPLIVASAGMQRDDLDAGFMPR